MQKTLFMIHPHGFCPGVRNALNIVNQALQDYSQQTIYVFNEIVHNKTIVTNLKNKGVIFTQNCADIVAKSVVILSAHGVSPDVKKTLLSKNCILIDATCHFVNKVHQEVIDYSKKGYHIIYIGTKNHEETLGVVGENPSNITIIETDADFANIKVDADKYVVLNQTTLNLDDIENLFKKIFLLNIKCQLLLCALLTSLLVSLIWPLLMNSRSISTEVLPLPLILFVKPVRLRGSLLSLSFFHVRTELVISVPITL